MDLTIVCPILYILSMGVPIQWFGPNRIVIRRLGILDSERSGRVIISFLQQSVCVCVFINFFSKIFISPYIFLRAEPLDQKFRSYPTYISKLFFPHEIDQISGRTVCTHITIYEGKARAVQTIRRVRCN